MVTLDRYLQDSDVLPVQERYIDILNNGTQCKIRILFCTAGYKDRILIGTVGMYERGHMQEFIAEDGIWYDMTSSNIFTGKFMMYLKMDENGTLNSCATIEMSMHYSGEPDVGVLETPLFTPIELKLLDKLRRDANDEHLRKLRIQDA